MVQVLMGAQDVFDLSRIPGPESGERRQGPRREGFRLAHGGNVGCQSSGNYSQRGIGDGGVHEIEKFGAQVLFKRRLRQDG